MLTVQWDRARGYASLPGSQGRQDGGSPGVSPEATPPWCQQHGGSLGAPSTAWLLIGADRAEEREKDDGGDGESKAMILSGMSPRVP